MRRLAVLIVMAWVCALLAIAPCLSAAGGAGIWPMFGHDAQHTSRSPFGTARKGTWKFKVGENPASSPVI